VDEINCFSEQKVKVFFLDRQTDRQKKTKTEIGIKFDEKMTGENQLFFRSEGTESLVLCWILRQK
jgi:hypothetical protein